MYPRITDIFSDLFGFNFPIPLFSFGAMVALAAITAGWLLGKELDRYHEGGRLNGVKIPNPEKGEGKGRKKKRMIDAKPSAIVWTVTVIALASGFAGAKVFHILENLDQFFINPMGMLFSSGGFTFYGGLIVATFVVAWYVKKRGLSVPIFADSLAPGLMISYGIGRIGCYLAGDGDWGICSSLADKPSWIPGFLWSETFPRNVLGPNQQPVDVLAYMECAPGADGVYPTMLYEFAMATALFGVLWSVRKHPFMSGWLFSLYLALNGVERFLIEQIRVNNVGDFLGFQVTQAEVIALVLFLLGVVGLFFTSRSRSKTEQSSTSKKKKEVDAS